MQLTTLSLIEEYEDLENVTSIVEIGGGFGALCEVIMKSSKVKKYFLFDISPMVYISTQYLKQAFPDEVADYIDYKNGVTKRITVLPTWCFEDVKDDFDLFINTASFQEMEKDVVENYLNHLKAKSIFILSLKDGHLEGAKDQKDQIDFDYLDSQVISRGFIQSNKAVSPEIALITDFADLEMYDYSFYQSSN